MKLITLLLCLSVSLLSAQNHSDHLPEDTLVLLRLNDIAATTQRWRESPLGRVFAGFAWQELLLSMAEEDTDAEELARTRTELQRLSEAFSEIAAHLQGDLTLAFQNFAPAVELLNRQRAQREAIWDGIDWDAEVEEGAEDPIDLALQQDLLLDARETFAFMGTFILIADVRDPETLLTRLSNRMTEFIQREEDVALTLTELDWQGQQVLVLREEADEDLGPEARALLALEPAIHWTVVGNRLLLTLQEEAMRSALTRHTQRPAVALSAVPAYQEALAFHDQADHFVFLNLPLFHSLIRSVLPQDQVPPGDIDPIAIFDRIGFDTFAPLTFSIRMEAEGIRSAIRAGFTRESVLSRLLMAPPDQVGRAPMPPFLHQNFHQVSTFNWSLSRFYDALEREIAGLVPQAAIGLGFARMAVTQQLGFDYKTGLLDHLGSGIAIAQESDWEIALRTMRLNSDEGSIEEMLAHSQAHPTGGTYSLVALELRNTQAVSSVLNTLLSQLGGGVAPQPEMFREQPLFFPMASLPFVPAEMRQFFGFTFLNDYLLLSIGHPRMLHRAIEASQDPGARIWETEAFQELRQHLPPDATAMDFTNGPAMAQAQNFLRLLLQDNLSETAPRIPEFPQLFQGSIGSSRRQGLMLESQTWVPFTAP